MTSPFIEGSRLQFAWDSTSLGWFKDCPRKYYYSMIEGWRAKRASIHLTFGILYHEALEQYDKARQIDGLSHQDAQEIMVQTLMEKSLDFKSDDSNKNRFTVVRSAVWYTEQFKDDPAKTIVLEDGKLALELSFRMEISRYPSEQPGFQALSYNGPYLLCGHLDRVVDYLGGTYVMDRKTTASTVGSYYFENYSPDNQMSLYSLAGRVVFNAPVRGVIVDAAQIAVGFTRFARGITYRTEGQLEEWLRDVEFHIAAAEKCARDDYWPTNDTACSKYGGCVFRKICGADPKVRQTFLESGYERRPWNPLEVRS